MKKFLAIVLALVMIFSLASLTACGDKEEKITPENTENPENTDVEVPEETEEEKRRFWQSRGFGFLFMLYRMWV